MDDDIAIYVGLDVSKEKIAIGLAEAGRKGEVRYYGEIANRADAVRKFVGKLADRHGRLCFCYEAGPTGYGLYRQLTSLGYECLVVAPSLVPTRPGNQIKTDRRDAVSLAAFLRADELSSIWVPDETHEAMRDLCRAREVAVSNLRRARQHLLSFLLRHGKIFEGRTHWSKAHRNWLARQRFEQRAQQFAMEEYIHAIKQIEERRDRLVQQMQELLPEWSLSPVVQAIQALRGVAQISAMTLVSEIGDFRRFQSPRQFMAWLGLVPKEHSTGASISRGSITKAGNTRARRMLVEGAWTYRLPARISPELLKRNEGLPEEIRMIAWKVQVRLCQRYRRMQARGCLTNIVIVAIARELAAFVWAIATTVLLASQR
ncbi:Transposase [Cohaesibacter sp. ES.047]|uniref:IS110 family transposase n=1 Tax=Cohaesibacter sp. ES.047 TaxID=1798205 RepID=UPI000BB6C60F|nr:IS110 family transposase [Cohaesibacter sp. ES.047]SNY93565.1 Transposase [Cohaesibacter sp. ES.047]